MRDMGYPVLKDGVSAARMDASVLVAKESPILAFTAAEAEAGRQLRQLDPPRIAGVSTALVRASDLCEADGRGAEERAGRRTARE